MSCFFLINWQVFVQKFSKFFSQILDPPKTIVHYLCTPDVFGSSSLSVLGYVREGWKKYFKFKLILLPSIFLQSYLSFGGLMVRTLDCHAVNRGSNPARGNKFLQILPQFFKLPGGFVTFSEQ